jgi:hypothetical protein
MTTDPSFIIFNALMADATLPLFHQFNITFILLILLDTTPTRVVCYSMISLIISKSFF